MGRPTDTTTASTQLVVRLHADGLEWEQRLYESRSGPHERQ